jgi:hypothetical protein
LYLKFERWVVHLTKLTEKLQVSNSENPTIVILIKIYKIIFVKKI